MKTEKDLLKALGINPKDMKTYKCQDCGCLISSNEKVELCSECEEK